MSVVAILTTGGTIAMRRDEKAGGAVPALTGQDFAAALPADLPPLRVEAVCNLPSSHFTLDTLVAIRERVMALQDDPDVLGVVVTHGTDTMEETAYLLDITVPGEKPIVLTGAMRTASDVGYEGYANLAAAVRVAASEAARGLGALVVMNDEVHAARHVTKTHTLSVDTFRSLEYGPLGRVDGGQVYITQRMAREVLPWAGLERRVALVKLTVGQEPDFLRWTVERGARGVVLEGLGGGRIPPWWLPVIEESIAAGVTVVIASRCPAGRVWDGYGYAGAYKSLRALGCLFANGLNGPKARLRLMVVLGAARTPAGVQELWG